MTDQMIDGVPGPVDAAAGSGSIRIGQVSGDVRAAIGHLGVLRGEAEFFSALLELSNVISYTQLP
jgi:hypothetical protein